MKTKEAWYAVVGGCVGAVLTMVVCSFSPLGAQSQSNGNFDMVTCRKLNVVDSDGIARVALTVFRDAGFVGVLDKNELPRAAMTDEEHGGGVIVFDKDRKPEVVVGVSEVGGTILVGEKDKSGAFIAVIEEGGVLTVFDKDGKFKSLTATGLR